MARKRRAEPVTLVYKVNATMPDGSVRTTSRLSRRAAKNVANSFIEGRDDFEVGNWGDVEGGRPPAQFVEIQTGEVDWEAEAKAFPGDF